MVHCSVYFTKPHKLEKDKMKKFVFVLMNYKKAFAAMRDLETIFAIVKGDKAKGPHFSYKKIGKSVVDYLYPTEE